MDLPPAPRTVIQPEVRAVPKRKLPLRAVLIPVLLLGLAAGGVYLAKLTAGPTPDERATEIAAKLAPGILVAFRADSDPASIAQLVAIRDAWEKDTGCSLVGGQIIPETTQARAVASAKRLIATTPTPETVGTGYVVVAANGAVPGYRFIAIVIAVRCAGPSPSPGFGVGS